MTSAPPRLFVGIDIAARSFTASWLLPDAKPAKPHTFDQSASGYAKLITALATTAVAPSDTLIVLEATGSYWVACASALQEAGFRICVVKPLPTPRSVAPKPTHRMRCC
jgi:transposase